MGMTRRSVDFTVPSGAMITGNSYDIVNCNKRFRHNHQLGLLQEGFCMNSEEIYIYRMKSCYWLKVRRRFGLVLIHLYSTCIGSSRGKLYCAPAFTKTKQFRRQRWYKVSVAVNIDVTCVLRTHETCTAFTNLLGRPSTERQWIFWWCTGCNMGRKNMKVNKPSDRVPNLQSQCQFSVSRKQSTH